MRDADKVLLLVVPVLAVWLGGILLRRRLYWRFPCFFIYVASLPVIGIIRLSVISHYRLYFKVFWSTEVVYGVLALLALHEIFRRVFLGFYLQFDWFRLLFPAAVALALAIVLWGAIHSPPVQAAPLISGILLFGIAVNLIQVGLFCMFMFLAAFFKLRWRHAPLGISLGFAIAAIGAVLGYWLRSEFGTRVESLTKYGPPVAYIVAVAIWLDTFLRPEPEPKWVSAVTLQQAAEAIQRDTIVIKKFLEKLK
jgi:hypothetical protein